jgi:hypothetical protein
MLCNPWSDCHGCRLDLDHLDITGWYLVGLVSSVGSSLIWIWLLVANRLHRRAAELPRGLIMLGIRPDLHDHWVVGYPGVVARIHDHSWPRGT